MAGSTPIALPYTYLPGTDQKVKCRRESAQPPTDLHNQALLRGKHPPITMGYGQMQSKTQPHPACWGTGCMQVAWLQTLETSLDDLLRYFPVINPSFALFDQCQKKTRELHLHAELHLLFCLLTCLPTMPHFLNVKQGHVFLQGHSWQRDIPPTFHLDLCDSPQSELVWELMLTWKSVISEE